MPCVKPPPYIQISTGAPLFKALALLAPLEALSGTMTSRKRQSSVVPGFSGGTTFVQLPASRSLTAASKSKACLLKLAVTTAPWTLFQQLFSPGHLMALLPLFHGGYPVAGCGGTCAAQRRSPFGG